MTDTFKLTDKKPSEKPTWVLQRQPHDKHTYIAIWADHESLKCTSEELAQKLADVIMSQQKEKKV